MAEIRNIRFSFPCKKKVDDMPVCEQGKHCKACERTIVDFREKTQEELDLLKENNTTICGIFSEKQVAKGYENYFQLAAATVLAIGLSGSFQNLHAQEEPDPFKFPKLLRDTAAKTAENLVVGVICEPQAEYPGGMNAMKDFLRENLVYPADSVVGKVRVSFVVNKSGRTEQIQIKQSLSPLADAEVIRVIGLMVFIPAQENGKPVDSHLSLPISFRMETKD